MGDDRKTWRKNLPEDFDGRFGENWDDEVSIKAVIQVSVGIAAVCAITFVFTWGMVVWFEGRADASQPAPSVIAEADEVRSPPGAPLQAHPEKEMEELRHAMEKRRDGWGWVDEAAGTVHIPVEQAMHLLLQQAGAAEGHGETQADDAAAAADDVSVSSGTEPSDEEPATADTADTTADEPAPGGRR